MRHPDTTCYIIGKGPSLDTLTPEDFGPGPIIAINESIVKIESLDLENPVYSLQQDGKPQCMRRPRKATLLLSERSKQWFPDYIPRHIYNQVDLGLIDKIFSAITAIAFAKKMQCKEIVFMCFDACTCGDASYATDIEYRDPKNSLGRFQRYCEIIKLSLGMMPARWHKGKEIKTAPYTAITLTGDRHNLFELCRKYLLRQTLLPAQWIVVDDGKIPLNWKQYGGSDYVRRQPLISDPRHTLCRNMLAALPYIKYDKIIIFEDDDWYNPKYAETLLPHLGTYDLVGLGDTHYYHYSSNRLHQFDNDKHSCLATTGFTRSLIPMIKDICEKDNSPLIDLELWQHAIIKTVIKPPHIMYVGMKGLIGRLGQTSGHRASSAYYKDDTDNWLESVLGDDTKYYEPFKISDINIPIIHGMKARYSHDGSIFIPRCNRQFENYMDKYFARVPGELRWYPRVVNSVPLNNIKSIFKGQTCYIVGKGRSLDALSKEDFGPGPIIAINEAIHKVESLDLPNPIFMMQQDVRLKDTCWPMIGTVLVPSNVAHLYHKHSSLCVFTLGQLGISGTPATVIVAIELAKLLKSTKLVLTCFDAYTQRETSYANCVGYSAEKYGAPTRFLQQAANIKRHLDISHSFITPTSLP